ncbi:MAG: helix-turn-helix domain-containing protein [Nocardioides sp.]
MTRPVDPIERAHLRDREGFTPPIHRFAPAPQLTDRVRRYWLPVWSLPEGRVSVQRVLQYPVCLVVVADDYARLVGPTTGLSTRELRGSGWAVGAMLQPAAGLLLSGRPVSELTDSHIDLPTVPGLAGGALAAGIEAVMRPDPGAPAALQRAVDLLEAALATLPPADEEGLLVNAVVEYAEGDSGVHRVGQIVEKFSITERTLQRLCARRIGLSPKWLIQRRRLHEAAERLIPGPGVTQVARGTAPDLARVAADLGYADQAHFTRDFRTVTGLTPGGFAREPRDAGEAPS